jgi:hypothetical protein
VAAPDGARRCIPIAQVRGSRAASFNNPIEDHRIGMVYVSPNVAHAASDSDQHLSLDIAYNRSEMAKGTDLNATAKLDITVITSPHVQGSLAC